MWLCVRMCLFIIRWRECLACVSTTLGQKVWWVSFVGSCFIFLCVRLMLSDSCTSDKTWLFLLVSYRQDVMRHCICRALQIPEHNLCIYSMSMHQLCCYLLYFSCCFCSLYLFHVNASILLLSALLLLLLLQFVSIPCQCIDCAAICFTSLAFAVCFILDTCIPDQALCISTELHSYNSLCRWWYSCVGARGDGRSRDLTGCWLIEKESYVGS